MKNIYTITEQEKNRILGMHQNATKKQYLMEDFYSGATGKNQDAENSKKIYSYLEYYCWKGTKDNKNIYSDIINPARPIASRATLDGIHTSAQNFIYNSKQGNSDTYKKHLLDQLKLLNGPSELCEFDRYLRNNGYQSGIHGVLSTITTLAITWDEVFNALTPALTDAYNIVQGAQTPEQTGTDDDESTPDNKPVENIATSLINLIRTNVGSKPGTGLTLTDDDLNKIIEKLGNI